jgi:hypothetical protein
MNVPKFNEREKALENDYIRRKEYVVPYSCLRHSTSIIDFGTGHNALLEGV